MSSASQGLPVVLSLSHSELETHEGRGPEYQVPPPGTPSPTVQFSCPVVSDTATPWTAALQASLSITNSQSSLKLTSIESVMPSNHLILCRPLVLPPSIFPSTRVFSNESVLCIRWPEYWMPLASVLPMNIQDRFPLGWTGWISLEKALRVLRIPQFKSINSSVLSFH